MSQSTYILPNPSNEQVQIIDNIRENDVIVNAVAGSGKTTTIFHVASKYNNKTVLSLTYSARLKADSRLKAAALNLNNIEVHSFHSFAVKYINSGAYTDERLIRLINDDSQLPSYDIIIVDEVQDMIELYFRLLIKILNYNQNSKLMLIGDVRQNIYKYKKSNHNYLCNADKIYTDRTFVKLNLSQSFRVTTNMSMFVNKCVLHQNVIVSNKIGPKVKYCLYNTFNPNKNIIPEIKKLLLEYNYDDIFILCPSTKSIGRFEVQKDKKEEDKKVNSSNEKYQNKTSDSKNPLTRLENELVKSGVKVFIPSFDDEQVSDECMIGKLCFLTFHQAKGLERKVVFVFGFDEDYFRYYSKENKATCPNVMYVAITRAKEKLYLIHHYDKKYLEFVDERSLIYNGVEIIGKHKHKETKIACNILLRNCPTGIAKHLCLEKLIEFEDNIKFNLLNPVNVQGTIKLPNTITGDNELYESIMTITPDMILSYHEYKTLGKLSICDQMNIPMPSKVTKKILTDCCIKFEEYKTGFKHKSTQISKNTTWLSSKVLKLLSERMKKNNILDGLYEYEIKNIIPISVNGEEKYLLIRGFIDFIDIKRRQLWEFKCSKDLTIAYKIQVATYARLWENVYNTIYSYTVGDKVTLKYTDVVANIIVLEKITNHCYLIEDTSTGIIKITVISERSEELYKNACVNDGKKFNILSEVKDTMYMLYLSNGMKVLDYEAMPLMEYTIGENVVLLHDRNDYTITEINEYNIKLSDGNVYYINKIWPKFEYNLYNILSEELLQIQYDQDVFQDIVNYRYSLDSSWIDDDSFINNRNEMYKQEHIINDPNTNENELYNDNNVYNIIDDEKSIQDNKFENININNASIANAQSNTPINTLNNTLMLGNDDLCITKQLSNDNNILPIANERIKKYIVLDIETTGFGKEEYIISSWLYYMR